MFYNRVALDNCLIPYKFDKNEHFQTWLDAQLTRFTFSNPKEEEVIYQDVYDRRFLSPIWHRAQNYSFYPTATNESPKAKNSSLFATYGSASSRDRWTVPTLSLTALKKSCILSPKSSPSRVTAFGRCSAAENQPEMIFYYCSSITQTYASINLTIRVLLPRGTLHSFSIFHCLVNGRFSLG